MRVLVFEYITGGGLLGNLLAPSLVHEGDMMLRALLADLLEIPGIEVVTTRDSRLNPLDFPIQVCVLHHQKEFETIWCSLLDEVDAVWPIAPDSLLITLCEQIIDAGRLLLNCRPSAVSLATNKLKMARHLEGRGIPAVPTQLASDIIDRSGQWMLKPLDGVGCEGVMLCEGRPDWRHAFAVLEKKTVIAQPYIEGTPASLSLLCRNGEVQVMSYNLQDIEVIDHQFYLKGCVVNGFDGSKANYRELAHNIAASHSGFWGYIGVDLMLTDSGPRVLEINPRLTTSYVGLHVAMNRNPAAMVLDLLDASKPLSCRPLAYNRTRVGIGYDYGA